MRSLDLILLASTAAVWALLALAYATVEMIAMPAAAIVWGAGAVVFAILAGLLAVAEGRR